MKRVSTDDFVAISDHLGRYCWAVDEGRADDWVALWTPDGTFTGIAEEPIVGREALRAIPTDAFRDWGDAMRHVTANLFCDYVDGPDTVLAQFYNYVTTWKDGGRHFVMALCKMTLVRHEDGWRIKRNDVKLLLG